jgi:hypothetical protein
MTIETLTQILSVVMIIVVFGLITIIPMISTDIR